MIDVFDFARTGGVVEGRLDLRDAARLRASLRDDAGTIGYRFEGSIDRHGRPAARLELRGELPLMCDRCAQPLQFPLEHVAHFFFVSDERQLAELPVTVEEDEEPVLGSGHFDLAALVEDESILCLPVSPRHAVCPAPTKAPSVGKHGQTRSPFAVLPDLLNGKRR